MKQKNGTTKVSSSDLVASSLLERILKGEWEVGDKIPSVDQLEKIFPASRVTISKGIRKLCRQGYLHAAWRSGTYVSSNVLVRRILLHVGGDLMLIRHCPFSMVVTRKLETLLTKHGMQVQIHWEARQPLAGSRLATDLLDDRFDGVISIQSNLPATVAYKLPSLLGRLPMVHVGIHHTVPWVFVDRDVFNRYACDCCLEADARRVLYFCPSGYPETESFNPPQSVTVHTVLPADGAWPELPTENSAYHLFRKAWKRLGGRLDAVVVADDIMAKGIAQAVLSLGDAAARVKIIALTNRDSGIFYPVPVTAIEVDTSEIARQALALLVKQLTAGTTSEVTGISIPPRPATPYYPMPTTEEDHHQEAELLAEHR